SAPNYRPENGLKFVLGGIPSARNFSLIYTNLEFFISSTGNQMSRSRRGQLGFLQLPAFVNRKKTTGVEAATRRNLGSRRDLPFDWNLFNHIDLSGHRLRNRRD